MAAKITPHPILQSLQFHVTDCPMVKGPHKAAYAVRPQIITVERRPRGTRIYVRGPSHQGWRGVWFNVEGYERNQQAPEWLMTLWARAQEDFRDAAS